MNKSKYIGEISIYVDGCSKGNPGPGGVGIVIVNPEDGSILFNKGFFLKGGDITNQDAEFQAIIKALEIAPTFCTKEVTVFSDSQLAVKELNRDFRIHVPRHRKFNEEIRSKGSLFEKVNYVKVPRENKYIKIADKLANKSVEKTKKGELL